MMTDHDRTAQLLAAALDFDLTADERAEMERHLAECDACRQIDDDLRADAVALQRQIRTDAPARVRHAIAEAAWREAVPHRSRAGLVLLVAAVLMLAMAIGGAFAAGMWLERRDESTRPSPSAGARAPVDLREDAGTQSALAWTYLTDVVPDSKAGAKGP